LLVGVVHDASFGPVIACGAGGTAVELLKDVAVRITPLTDVAALEESLLRISAMVEAPRRSPSWTATPSRCCLTVWS
jgi:acetate---CoA ligase (ADP-forming)